MTSALRGPTTSVWVSTTRYTATATVGTLFVLFKVMTNKETKLKSDGFAGMAVIKV